MPDHNVYNYRMYVDRRPEHRWLLAVSIFAFVTFYSLLLLYIKRIGMQSD
jgi:hypothetical protein